MLYGQNLVHNGNFCLVEAGMDMWGIKTIRLLDTLTGGNK